jgi:hypothetical protein
VNKDGFKPNVETHLIPLLASKLEETASPETKEKSTCLETKEKSTTIYTKAAHHPLLMQVSVWYYSFFHILFGKNSIISFRSISCVRK